jgi:hypothetical protein
MKTNYTTKQFALFLRKRCSGYDEDWRVIPRSGVETVNDKTRLAELAVQFGTKGAWYFFEVHDGRAGCGIYVGPERNILAACNPFNRDPLFEARLHDCLEGG